MNKPNPGYYINCLDNILIVHPSGFVEYYMPNKWGIVHYTDVVVSYLLDVHEFIGELK